MSETDTATYSVAKQTLKVEGVKAFAKGDDVPDSTVKRYGWEDLVVAAETKTGKAAAAAEKVRAEAAEPSDVPAQPGL